MLSIMIVDDDPLLCTAMRRKIEMVDQGNRLEVQEVVIAHSAQEAWELLNSRFINVLISDIQMPYQSGLELIDRVNKAFPGIQLVILSGYDDYEYMRGALRSGVVDYLLKPVKLVQVQEVLLKCAENLRCRDEQESQEENDCLEALGKWLNGLLRGETEPAPQEFPYPVFWVAWQFGAAGERALQVMKEFCASASQEGAVLFPVRGDRGECLLLVNSEDCGTGPVEKLLQDCRDFCAAQGEDVRFAVSQPFTSLVREYPVFYKEARYTMAYRMLEPFTLRFASPQTGMLPSKLPKYHTRIHAAFQSRNFSQIYQWLDKVFCPAFFQERPYPQEIRSFYTYWASQVQEMATTLHVELEVFPYFSWFDSFDAMRSYFQKVLRQVEEVLQESTNKYAYIISTATKYVEENYNREISMNEVAEMVSVSYSYFSRLFKEQMHQSFSEYVASVRMREARRLMEEDPAIKMKDVAALVGYESVYAFSRAYKQYFHVSPKQGRER